MSMDKLAEAWRQHLRIGILRVLASAPAYSANESLLTDALHELGFGATRDQVRTELAWLAEQSLVTLEDLGGLKIATITQRGIDVTEGRAAVPGVKKPSPRA
jgi:hypothetical protein